MKKSTKRQLKSRLRKVTRHQSFKKTGIGLICLMALAYAIYQVIAFAGIFDNRL